MALFRYWRIHYGSIFGSTGVTLAELQLRGTAGGANLATNSAKITADQFSGASTPAKAIDGSQSLAWQTTSIGSTATPWICYDFGTPTEILEVTLSALTSSGNGMPATGTIEASADGDNWVPFVNLGTLTWTAAETKTFTVPASTPAPPAVTTLASSKLTGYAVVGSFPDRTAATKVVGYAVTGPRPDGVSANKINGYAVIGPRPDAISINKVNGYAVVYDPTTGAPNPLALGATHRWMGCSPRMGLS